MVRRNVGLRHEDVKIHHFDGSAAWPLGWPRASMGYGVDLLCEFAFVSTVQCCCALCSKVGASA